MNIHIATAFYRAHLLPALIGHYEPMGVIWHPVIFDGEAHKFKWPSAAWVQPLTIPDNVNVSNFIDIGYHKNNVFIRSKFVNDDDHYLFLDDDDMIEPASVNAIMAMHDDIIFISLKRGHSIPKKSTGPKRYGTSTLIANSINVFPGKISKQQLVMKGKILRRCNFLEKVHYADGILAFWLKEHYAVCYRPDLYALFNYFEPERWEVRTS